METTVDSSCLPVIEMGTQEERPSFPCEGKSWLLRKNKSDVAIELVPSGQAVGVHISLR